jgi:putative ABC transport system permease protein
VACLLAGALTLVGCWLGVAAGFLPGWSMVHSINDVSAPSITPTPLVVPWDWIGALTLGLPVLTALVVGLAVRSRIPLNRRTD